MPFKQSILEQLTEKLRVPDLSIRDLSSLNQEVCYALGWKWTVIYETHDFPSFWSDDKDKKLRGFNLPNLLTESTMSFHLLRQLLPGWTLNLECRDYLVIDGYVIGPNFKDNEPWAHSSRPIGNVRLPQAIVFCVIDGLLSQTRTE